LDDDDDGDGAAITARTVASASPASRTIGALSLPRRIPEANAEAG
jgi:hypothetical protein